MGHRYGALESLVSNKEDATEVSTFYCNSGENKQIVPVEKKMVCSLCFNGSIGC